MKRPPRISETEWEVMRIVWARRTVPAAAIIAELMAQDPTWHPKTVRTLLARLVDKGALDYRERGRAYVYEAKVTEGYCVAVASGSFLDRVFGGSLKPMLVHFLERGRLTREELNDLRAVLDES